VTFWEAILAQLKADKKKTGALTVLFLLLIGVCARAFLKSPASAGDELTAASPVTTKPTATQGGPTIVAAPLATAADSSPQSTGSTLSIAGAMLPAESGSGDSGASGESAVPIAHFSRDMSRDLFQTDWSAFPPTAETIAASNKGARTHPQENVLEGWRKTLSLLATSAADSRSRQQAMVTHVQEMKVQAILLAPKAKAYVNGHWVSVGSVIGGFEVLEITSEEVVLGKSGCHVRLTMP